MSELYILLHFSPVYIMKYVAMYKDNMYYVSTMDNYKNCQHLGCFIANDKYDF